MAVIRVVLLIDASHETAAELSRCVCDTLLKPVLDRLEMLHEGSDLRLAIVSYSFPSSPDGPDLSVTGGSFERFGDSYSILRTKPLSVGLGRLSNIMGDSMALIDGFIQALKLCDGEIFSHSSIHPIFHFIVITSYPPQITRHPPRASSQLDSLVWEKVPTALRQRGINLSLIQSKSHPLLLQLLHQTMGSSPFTSPWFPTGSYLVKLSGMNLHNTHRREHKVLSTPQSKTDPRGTKRKHHEEYGLMGEDGAIDPSKRPRQVSSIGSFKYPLPRSRGNFAHGGVAKAHLPPIPTAGLVVSNLTTPSAFPSTDVSISSQREGGVTASAFSPSGNVWTSSPAHDADISTSWDLFVPGGPSLDPLKSMIVHTDTGDISVRQAMTPGQGPHSTENAAAHVPTSNSLYPDKTNSKDPHPKSVVTNNAQSWDPTRMLDSLQGPIGYSSFGLSPIAPSAAAPHPHHPADRESAQGSAQSLPWFTTGQSHYQPHPIVSRRLRDHSTSPTALNAAYPASREIFGAPTPDYSDVSSTNRQDLNNAKVSSDPTPPQPPSPVVSGISSIAAPVREDSLDTLICSFTAPVGTEPLPVSSAFPLPEGSSSTMNRNGVTQHLSSSQSSLLPNGDEAENDSIATGTGSDDEFDEYKSMGVLKLIMERAASKKSKERLGRFKKKARPGAAPSVELNTQPIAPPPPTSLQQIPQAWATPSPSIIVSRPESDPTEWYGHLVLDVSLGEDLSALGPISVAISLSSTHFSARDLPNTIGILASDLRRPTDWASFHMFLGAHNVTIFSLRHYLAPSGSKPLPGSSTVVGYDRFFRLLRDNKMFASIEFPGQAPGTGIAVFPWMGPSGDKLQVALFDSARPLPTMEELTSYVQNMGLPMMPPSQAPGRTEVVSSSYSNSASRTAQFAREMQQKQQEHLMIGSNPSSELIPSPQSYSSSLEQDLSFDQAIFGHASYDNSAPQLLLSPASTSSFQITGQLDTYSANFSPNEYDLSPSIHTNTEQSNPASPASFQYVGIPGIPMQAEGEYTSPEYPQMTNPDSLHYGALLFNPSLTEDNGYAPQSGTQNAYYGQRTGYL